MEQLYFKHFFQSRESSCCGLVSLYAHAMHQRLLSLCDGGLPVCRQVVGSAHGEPHSWSTANVTTAGEGRSPSGCQRLLGRHYSRSHCGRASRQAAPSGSQDHPRSQEACSRLFCSSSTVCNQLQSRDWKSTCRLKIQWPPTNTSACLSFSGGNQHDLEANLNPLINNSLVIAGYPWAKSDNIQNHTGSFPWTGLESLRFCDYGNWKGNFSIIYAHCG